MIRIHLLLPLLAVGLLGSSSDAQEGAAEGQTLLDASTTPASTDPERIAAAKAMLDSMDMEDFLKESIGQTLEAQMGQFRQMGLSEEGVVELHETMLSFLLETMDWKSLEPEFIRMYASAFTAQEMKDITAFYETPAGKKATALTPKLMAEGMLLGQRKVEARQAELEQRIAPIIQKHVVAPR